MLKQYILGKITVTSEAFHVMDMNADGNVDAIDFALFKKLILGSI
ncbi:dockerin type I repeat-containing protein [Ruminiclostridium josui]|nr:dockerin type I repeat-containing protein [Ruminiclostridium josui]